MGNSIEITNNVPRADTVKQIIKSALGEPATHVAFVAEQGNVNSTYDVTTGSGSFIVRTRFDRVELYQFLREKRCAELIRAAYDWTPEIISVGTFDGHSYSIQRKVQGIVASRYQGDLANIWEQVGHYAEFFHGIKTSGYIYDAFREEPVTHGLWCQWYFDYLGEAKNSKLVARKLLTEEEFDTALESLNPLRELKFSPTLAHGNLLPQNLIVDSDDRAHIIDWGTCQGHLSTELDLSELLAFDIPEQHVQAYLRGHNLPPDYVEQNRDLLERLRLVRCFTSAHWLCETASARETSVLRYIERVQASVKILNP